MIISVRTVNNIPTWYYQVYFILFLLLFYLFRFGCLTCCVVNPELNADEKDTSQKSQTHDPTPLTNT